MTIEEIKQRYPSPRSAENIEILSKEFEWLISQVVTLRFWREQNLVELKRVKDENKKLRERLVVHQAKESDNDAALELESQLTAANAKIIRLEDDYKHTREHADALSKRGHEVYDQLTTANAEIARLKESYTNMSDAHNKEFARAESERESKIAARGEVDRLRRQIGDERETKERARHKIDDFSKQLGELRKHCLVYRVLYFFEEASDYLIDLVHTYHF